MNIKRLVLVITVFAITLLGATAISAQDTSPDRPTERERPDRRIGNLVEIITTETGLTAQEILQAVREGATLAEVIEANGGSTQAVVDAALEQATERIDTALENGRLTEERATEILANLENGINEALNRTFEPRELGDGELRDRIGDMLNRSLVGRTAATLDMEPSDLLTQMREGRTLAEILSENGVDLTTFTAEALADAEAQINEAVESGRITAEQAEQLLSRLQEAINTRLNHEFEGRPNRPGRPGSADAANNS